MNPFGILPMMRYIIPLFQKDSTFVYTIQIEGFYDFHASATQVNLDICRDVKELNTQSRWRRYRKYALAIFYLILEMSKKGNSRFYFIDYQLLAIAIWIKKYWLKNAHVIYHQFELFDPTQFNGISRKLQLSVLRNACYIDFVIFPEINRLNFFSKASGIELDRTFLLPNTNNLHPGFNTITDDLLGLPASSTVLAHVGSLGSAHYTRNYFEFVKSNQDPDLRFLFIGLMDNAMLEEVTAMKANDDRIIYIPVLPHDEMIRYYERIDIGLILYKGVDLNCEFCAPNKLYEYWAYGIPVIAHTLEGLKPVWKKEFQGKLIDFENKQQLQCAVEQLKLSSIAFKEELREYFYSTFSFNSFLPALEASIEKW